VSGNQKIERGRGTACLTHGERGKDKSRNERLAARWKGWKAAFFDLVPEEVRFYSRTKDERTESEIDERQGKKGGDGGRAKRRGEREVVVGPKNQKGEESSGRRGGAGYEISKERKGKS